VSHRHRCGLRYVERRLAVVRRFSQVYWCLWRRAGLGCRATAIAEMPLHGRRRCGRCRCCCCCSAVDHNDDDDNARRHSSGGTCNGAGLRPVVLCGSVHGLYATLRSIACGRRIVAGRIKVAAVPPFHDHEPGYPLTCMTSLTPSISEPFRARRPR
jgi:hypothetical protein